MLEITFLGQLVATLAGAASFVYLLVAIGAAAFVLTTAEAGLAALPAPGGSAQEVALARQKSFASLFSIVFALALFFLTIATISVGSSANTLLFALGLGALGRSSVASLWLLGSRQALALSAKASLRKKAFVAANEAKALAAATEAKRKLAGEDLRDEVMSADAALERLRSALSALVDTRAALVQKLKAAGESGAAAIDPEVKRLRDELSLRIALGERVLAAAEEAAFRLACAVPIKKLVRRRPTNLSLLDPAGQGDPAARLDEVIASIDGFLKTMRETRFELAELAERRPTLPPPGDEEVRASEAGEPIDSLDRASRDVDAIERAYFMLRERAELARLGLRARSEIAEVANAAGAVSKGAQAFGLEEGELKLLINDLARVEQATAVEWPSGDEDLKALAEALAKGARALDRDDRASLGELVKAFGEIG